MLDNLFQKALEVREKAYCPYSKFKVGAAVQTVEGLVFVGSNVENISYGLSICAERIAIFNAVSNGYRAFSDLLVVADTEKPVSPCGACLQVMSEFSIKKIHLSNIKGEINSYVFNELLPVAFSNNNLKNE